MSFEAVVLRPALVPSTRSTRTRILKVLLVEDNRFVRRAMARCLRRVSSLRSHAGEHVVLHVMEAEDGHAARTLLAGDEPIDLVLTDCHMPLLSGLDLLVHLRARETLQRIPVVAFSAGDADALQDAINLGANAVMQKPVRETDMLEVLCAMLGLHQQTEVLSNLLWEVA